MDTLPYGPATRAHFSFVLERSAFGRNRETAKLQNRSMLSASFKLQLLQGKARRQRAVAKRREETLCDP